MHITNTPKQYINNNQQDDEGDIYFDCEETQECSFGRDDGLPAGGNEETIQVSMGEDLQRALIHLVSIAGTFEAKQLSITLLGKLGLDIPVAVVTAAASLHDAWRGGKKITGTLLAGLPLFVQAALPHLDRVPYLADFLRRYVTDHQGAQTLGFFAGRRQGDNDEDDFLWLGVVLLISLYYCAQRLPPLPERRWLNISLGVGQLLAEAGAWWNMLCRSLAPAITHGDGRLALSALEKERQMQGRLLARQWAKAPNASQTNLEQRALRHYGIEALSPSRNLAASPALSVGLAPVGNTGIALPSPVPSHAATPWRLALPPLTLLPVAQAAPARSAISYDTLGRFMAPAQSFERLRIALQNAYPSLSALKASGQFSLEAYRASLEAYWSTHYDEHRLYALIEMLLDLGAAGKTLSAAASVQILGMLGLRDSAQVLPRVYSFDINGYQATDLLVIADGPKSMMVLYLPRATVRWREFDNLASLRSWLVTQCRDPVGKAEIGAHFGIRERLDAASPLSLWGVDRWLHQIGDYPQHIQQSFKPLPAPLYDILAQRQKKRALEDASLLNLAGSPALASRSPSPDPLAPEFNSAPFASPNAKQQAILAGGAPAASNAAGRALQSMLSSLNELLAEGPNGELLPGRAFKLPLEDFISLIRHDLSAAWPNGVGSAGVNRVISALAVTPLTYRRVTNLRHVGRVEMMFTLTLRQKDGRQLKDINAIRMHSALLPLRFNGRVKMFEVYAINHPERPGYPVCHGDGNRWRFGQPEEKMSLAESDIAMADYRFVTVHLYQLIMDNLAALCTHGRGMAPMNSRGISKDDEGNRYLTFGIHYLALVKGPDGEGYRLGNAAGMDIHIRFDETRQKWRLLSNPPATPPKHFPPTSLNAAGLSLHSLADLSPTAPQGRPAAGTGEHYMAQASVIKRAFSEALHQVRHLLSAGQGAERQRLHDALTQDLNLANAPTAMRQKAYTQVKQRLTKMQAILEGHAGDGYARLWLAELPPPAPALVAMRNDPLKRWVFNAALVSERLSTGMRSFYCRYGCDELTPEEVTIMTDPDGDDYASLYERLWQGKMHRNEINMLISLPQANKVEEMFQMSDRTLAKRLMRKKPAARIAMLLNDAQSFSLLLSSVFNRLNQHRHPVRPDEQAWTGMIIFMAALQSL